MSLILRQVIGELRGRRASIATDPELKKQLTESQKQLNSILNKWKFGDQPIKSAPEFLNNFEPWINSQLEKQKEWKVFLAKKGVSSLAELADLPTEESEQLKFYKENIKIKEQIINEYKNQEQIWANTEADYLSRIEELKASSSSELSEADQEKLAEYEDLITERDQALIDVKDLEQQNLALNNRLRNKHQEVQNKDQALEKLKREKSQLEVQQQKQLKEKNGLITTLNQEIKQHKDKYTKQSKLLDTEQLTAGKLEEENEKLTQKNKELDQQNAKLVGRLLELDPPSKVDL